MRAPSRPGARGVFFVFWRRRADEGACRLAAGRRRSPRAAGSSLGPWGAAVPVGAGGPREPLGAVGGGGRDPGGGGSGEERSRALGRKRGAGGYPEGEAAWARGASASRGPAGGTGAEAGPAGTRAAAAVWGATASGPRACPRPRRLPLTCGAAAGGSGQSAPGVASAAAWEGAGPRSMRRRGAGSARARRAAAASGRGERTKPASRRGATGSDEGQDASGRPYALKEQYIVRASCLKALAP